MCDGLVRSEIELCPAAHHYFMFCCWGGGLFLLWCTDVRKDVMVSPSAWLRKVEGEVFEDSVTSSKVFYIFIDCCMIYRNLKMDAS